MKNVVLVYKKELMKRYRSKFKVLTFIMFVVGILIPIGGPAGFTNYCEYETTLNSETIFALTAVMYLVQGALIGILFMRYL